MRDVIKRHRHHVQITYAWIIQFLFKLALGLIVNDVAAIESKNEVPGNLNRILEELRLRRALQNSDVRASPI